jgi:dienelactone hydrolase
VRLTLALIGFFCAPAALAAATMTGDLPRRDGKALEDIAGVDTEYGVMQGAGGAQLRTILTRPVGAKKPVPAILFVQWLSCDSIDVPATSKSGWAQMLLGVASQSGVAMLRTDKPGVGDSPGDCASLDYETELAHHRAALAQLRRTPGIAADRIVVFGASMGANMAPLVADAKVAGVMTWGGGAKTWLERTLGFERRAKEFSGMPAAELDTFMHALPRLLVRYLVDRQAPSAIARAEPALGEAWKRMAGTKDDSQYGRPAAFHQQAHAQNWATAWSAVRAPVLVTYGEYDWFEDLAAHQLVVDLVNRGAPGRAQLAVLPQTDHHFMRYATPQAAFKGEKGTGIVNADAAVKRMVQWLREIR